MKRLIGCTFALCLVAIMVGCGGVTSSGTLAYLSNSSGTGFTVFTVNTDGTLTKSSISPQNSPTPPGDGPKVLQFSPNGKWAYFLDLGGANIYAYTRAGNGTLANQIGCPTLTSQPSQCGVSTHGQASSLVISPNSQFLYVALPQAQQATQPGAIAVFSIDAATGIIGQVGSNITTLGVPVDQLVMSQSGTLLFGLSIKTQTVVIWTLSTSSGALTQVSPSLSVGSTPSHMILSANGTNLYITDSTATSLNSNIPGVSIQTPNIYGYSVGASGTLTPMAGSPFNEDPAISTDATGTQTITAPTNPIAGATSNDSRYLFIANQGTHNISVFKIDSSTGELKEVTGTNSTINGSAVSTASPFDCGCTTPSFVAVPGANNALYVLDPGVQGAAGKILQFKIDQSTGRLRAQNPASLSAEGNPTWITIR